MRVAQGQVINPSRGTLIPANDPFQDPLKLQMNRL